MADPNDPLSEFDLPSNLSNEDKAKLLRQRQKALGRQRDWAVLSMLGGDVSPETARAGEAQFGQAEQERAATQEMAPSVLRRTLAERELGLRAAGLAFEREKFGKEFPLAEQREKREAAAPFLKAIIEGEASVRQIQALASFFGPSVQALATKILGAKAQSMRDAAIAEAKALGIDVTPVYGTGQPGAPGAAGTRTDELRQKYLKKP